MYVSMRPIYRCIGLKIRVNYNKNLMNNIAKYLDYLRCLNSKTSNV